jgi:uncharacterized protein YqjF (DUF2071 family)
MSVFLEAEWRKLVMANYAVDPNILKPYLPYRTELDVWQNNCYVSLVGFMFLNTRVKGFRIPFHVNFEEVNLRFYVRYKDDGVWKRGVVFIREIVPKLALSLVANLVYGEPYVTMPMRHDWSETENSLKVSYEWKKNRWHSMSVEVERTSFPILDGSEEEFITEHYWGYTRRSEVKTSEYGVEHPRWEHFPVMNYHIDVDFGLLYGDKFAHLSMEKPHSVLLAEGSEIRVLGGKNI